MRPDLPSASGIASLEKGLSLLACIVEDGGKTSLPALARPLNLSRSTLYRLTGALEQRGMIVRVAPGRYDIGVPFLKLVQPTQLPAHMARIARPFLRRLARTCRATAHLGVLDNDMVTYLVKVSAAMPAQAAMFTRENAQLEAYCSGIGKILLAWLPPEKREAYLAGGPFVALTPQTITDPAQLRAHLAAVRDQGFAQDNEEVERGVRCLAVPVPAGRDGADIAISLSFSGPCAPLTSYRAPLEASAAAIGAAFGAGRKTCVAGAR